MRMMGNDFNDGLSERGFLGVLWDSWDLVLVVWGFGFWWWVESGLEVE